MSKDEEIKESIRSNLKIYKNIQIYSKNLIIENQKYMMTSSCCYLIEYLLRLKKVADVLTEMEEEFAFKTADVIKLFLFNSERLLINGIAISFKIVRRINTKILALHVLQTSFINMFITAGFGLIDGGLFDFTVSHKNKVVDKIVAIVGDIIKANFEIFRDIDLNEEDSRVITPTKPCSDVIKTLFQVHRAVADFLLLADLLTLFTKIEKSFVDNYLAPMKSQIYIQNEVGHQVISEELEFIRENTKELFGEKLNLDLQMIEGLCQEIESEKTVYVMP